MLKYKIPQIVTLTRQLRNDTIKYHCAYNQMLHHNVDIPFS